VPWEEWQSFVPEFGERHRGWLIVIGNADDVQTAHASEWRPLQMLVLRADSAVTIGLGDDRRPAAITIRSIRHIDVELANADNERGLVLTHDDGTESIVRFRTSALPEAVDGIAPAE
jgi:hypothetical protein